MFCLEHWKTPTYPLAPAKMPRPLACAIAGLPAALTFSPLWLDLGPGWSFISPIQPHIMVNSPMGFGNAFRRSGPTAPPTQFWPPRSPCRGEQAWYLLVQEQVPSQETFLPAQQDPIPTLGFSSAAGLRHLITVQSQESKNGCKLKVFRPVDPTATKLGGEQREGSSGWELAPGRWGGVGARVNRQPL